jgi:hypothetical protein
MERGFQDRDAVGQPHADQDQWRGSSCHLCPGQLLLLHVVPKRCSSPRESQRHVVAANVLPASIVCESKMLTENSKEWEVAVKDKHNCMVKSGAWKAAPHNKIRSEGHCIPMGHVEGEKSDVMCRARMNARGCKQVDGGTPQEGR